MSKIKIELQKELANARLRKITINQTWIENPNLWAMTDLLYDTTDYYETEAEAVNAVSVAIKDRDKDFAGCSVQQGKHEMIFEVVENGRNTKTYKSLSAAKASITRENNKFAKNNISTITQIDTDFFIGVHHEKRRCEKDRWQVDCHTKPKAL